MPDELGDVPLEQPDPVQETIMRLLQGASQRPPSGGVTPSPSADELIRMLLSTRMSRTSPIGAED